MPQHTQKGIDKSRLHMTREKMCPIYIGATWGLRQASDLGVGRGF